MRGGGRRLAASECRVSAVGSTVMAWRTRECLRPLSARRSRHSHLGLHGLRRLGPRRSRADGPTRRFGVRPNRGRTEPSDVIRDLPPASHMCARPGILCACGGLGTRTVERVVQWFMRTLAGRPADRRFYGVQQRVAPVVTCTGYHLRDDAFTVSDIGGCDREPVRATRRGNAASAAGLTPARPVEGVVTATDHTGAAAPSRCRIADSSLCISLRAPTD